MAAVVRTNLRTVLLALRAKLVADLAIGEERILPIARPDTDVSYDPHGDYYILIRCHGNKWERTQVGGGRLDNRVRRRTTVTLRTRLLLDPPAEDTAWLTHASLGHHYVEHLLFNSLEGKYLTSGDNLLLFEGMLLADATPAERPPERAGWGQSSMSFDLCYTLDLTAVKLSDL